MKKIYKEYYPYVSKTYGGKNREYLSLTKEEKNMFFFWWDGIDSLPNKAKRNLELIILKMSYLKIIWIWFIAFLKRLTDVKTMIMIILIQSIT